MKESIKSLEYLFERIKVTYETKTISVYESKYQHKIEDLIKQGWDYIGTFNDIAHFRREKQTKFIG